jgi:hypothetical protein
MDPGLYLNLAGSRNCLLPNFHGNSSNKGENPETPFSALQGQPLAENSSFAYFNLSSSKMGWGRSFQAVVTSPQALKGQVAFLGSTNGIAVEGDFGLLASREAMDLNSKEGGAAERGRVIPAGIGLKSWARLEAKLL